MNFSKIVQCFDTYYKQLNFLYKLLFFLGALGYLGYHTLSGKNGYKSYTIIKKEISEKQKILDKLKNDLEDFKLKVKHLSSTSLDLDLLEERCRVTLNYAYPNEIIIRTISIPNLNR